MHGFNRLGGNSVAETVVGGMIVGEFIADFCDRPENHVQLSTGLIHEFLSREQAKLDAFIDGNGKEEANAIRGQMQDLMTAKVGIFRTGEDLASAVEELQALLLRSRNIGLRYRARGANPELVSAYRVQKMLKLALCIAYGALTRTESRGAHFRQDFPRRDDARVAEAHAGHVAERRRHVAFAGMGAARRDADGAAARMARLRRQGLCRPSRHGQARRGGRSDQGAARRRGTLRAFRRS